MYIASYKKGIQLLDNNQQSKSNNPLVIENLLALPLNVFLLNTESKVQHINEFSAAMCGYVSTHDARNRCIREIVKRNTADKVIANDITVMKSERPIIVEESFIRPDGRQFKSISFKFPCYQNDKISGVFGISIMQSLVDQVNIADKLSVLASIGLINLFHENSGNLLQRNSIKDIYLSDVEKSILSLLVQGGTAKIIGRKLNLSHRTIEHYLAQLKLKTNTSSKRELKEWAAIYLATQ